MQDSYPQPGGKGEVGREGEHLRTSPSGQKTAVEGAGVKERRREGRKEKKSKMEAAEEEAGEAEDRRRRKRGGWTGGGRGGGGLGKWSPKGSTADSLACLQFSLLPGDSHFIFGKAACCD